MKLRDENKWYQAYVLECFCQHDTKRAFDTLEDAKRFLKLSTKAMMIDQCYGPIVGVVWEMPTGKIVHKMRIKD